MSDSSGERRGLARNLTLSAASLLSVVFVAELACRLAGYGGFVKYLPDPETGWVLAPNQVATTKVGGFPIHVNAEGFRDEPLTSPRSESQVRIYALGNSATFGWGIPNDSAYHQRLERMLNAGAGQRAHEEIRYEIINAGVNAYGSAQVTRYVERILETYEPDGFLIAFTFNDTWNRFAELEPAERRRLLLGVRLKSLLRESALYNWLIELRGRWLYERIRGRFGGNEAVAHRGTLAASGEQLSRYRRNLETLVDRARESGVEVAFVLLAGKDQTGEWPLQDVMREVAREHGIPIADMASTLPTETDDVEALYLSGDGVHPSTRGHEVIARQLYATLCNAANASVVGTIYDPACGSDARSK